MTQSPNHASSSHRRDVTFRGRGHGILVAQRLILRVCPECSQWNAPKAADKGLCGWCAYVPSLADAEDAADAIPTPRKDL